MSELLTFSEIAKKLGVGIDTIRRTVARVGERLNLTVCRKSHSSRTQCLSVEDAKELVAYFEARDAGEPPEGREPEPASFQRFGSFYIVQLVPEGIPNRVKLGYTDNLERRLSEHQSAAPTARDLGHWPCKRAWDQAAMDSITREGCRLVMNEVYEGDLEGFLKRAEEFFGRMPGPTDEVPLSEHSPLAEPENGDSGDPANSGDGYRNRT